MKLKPCPFCGSENVRMTKYITSYAVLLKAVECAECRGSGAYREKEEDAIAAWNRRKENVESKG